MIVIDPQTNPIVATPDHTLVTSQEIAGKSVGAKSCDVKLGVYAPGGESIFHDHPCSEHVFYLLKGQLTAIDGAKQEVTVFQGQAVYIPAGEGHKVVNRGKEDTLYVAVTAPPTS